MDSEREPMDISAVLGRLYNRLIEQWWEPEDAAWFCDTLVPRGVSQAERESAVLWACYTHNCTDLVSAVTEPAVEVAA